MLPEIVRAVDGRAEVYIDGGICYGTDVLKALALGARAVFIGRPILFGLTYKVWKAFLSLFSLATFYDRERME